MPVHHAAALADHLPVALQLLGLLGQLPRLLLDRRLAQLQPRAAQLQVLPQLADPALYEKNDGALIQKLNQEQAAVAEKIDTAEMRWLELQEELEALPVPD